MGYKKELYLNEEEQKERNILFVHCEDHCGLIVEFQHTNSSFYFCKEHGTGINLDLNEVPSEGVVCEQHGKMELCNLLKDDNICPRCSEATLAIMSGSKNG